MAKQRGFAGQRGAFDRRVNRFGENPDWAAELEALGLRPDLAVKEQAPFGSNHHRWVRDARAE